MQRIVALSSPRRTCGLAVRLLLLALFALLEGCAAQVVRSPDLPASEVRAVQDAKAARQIVLLVDASPQIRASRDWSDFVEEWRAGMAKAALDAGLHYRFVTSEAEAGNAPAVLARVHVNDYRMMSQATRLIVGVMAGNAYVNVRVDYVELPAKTILETKTYNTSTRGSQGIFSGTTWRHIEALTKEIAGEVAKLGAGR